MTTEHSAHDDPRGRGHGPLRQAQGGPALHPRQGRVHRGRQPAGPAVARHRPLAVRPREDQVDRRDRGAQDPGRRRRRHRQGPRGLQAALDADPRRRHADGAPGGHRHVPVAGGGGRHRDRRATPRPTASPRSRWTTSRCRSSSTRSRRSSRTRPVLRPDRGEDKQTNHIWHWESGDEAAADAALADAEVTVSEDIYIPRIHVASIETCGCVADWDAVRQQLTLHMTSQAPHAIRTVLALVAAGAGCRSTSTTSGSRPTTSAAASAARCRSTRATCSRSPRRSSPASRSSGSRTVARTSRPTRSPATTTSTPSWAPRRTARSPALKVKTIADHGYTDAAADPSKFPAGLFNVITGSYDFANAFVEVDGVYTNKPPGGVAYRCSFRVTEAVHAIERMVDILAHEIGKDPAAAPDGELHPARAVPVQDADGLGVRLGQLPGRRSRRRMDMIGYEGLRTRAGREARPRRADGHRHLHRSPRSSAPARRTTSTSSA